MISVSNRNPAYFLENVWKENKKTETQRLGFMYYIDIKGATRGGGAKGAEASP